MVYELRDFIQVKLMGIWLIMWLLEIDWCIILLRINEKKNKKFIQVKNEWMQSDVLMLCAKIHGPTGMGFEAQYLHRLDDSPR